MHVTLGKCPAQSHSLVRASGVTAALGGHLGQRRGARSGGRQGTVRPPDRPPVAPRRPCLGGAWKGRGQGLGRAQPISVLDTPPAPARGGGACALGRGAPRPSPGAVLTLAPTRPTSGTLTPATRRRARSSALASVRPLAGLRDLGRRAPGRGVARVRTPPRAAFVSPGSSPGAGRHHPRAAAGPPRRSRRRAR